MKHLGNGNENLHLDWLDLGILPSLGVAVTGT